MSALATSFLPPPTIADLLRAEALQRLDALADAAVLRAAWAEEALKHPWICQRERVASVFHR